MSLPGNDCYLPAYDEYPILLKILLLSSLLFMVTGCGNQPELEITSIPDEEAAGDAKTIRSEVSVQLADDDLVLSLWASEKLLADPIGLDVTNDGEAFVSVTNRRSSSKPDIRWHEDWMTESMSWTTVEERANFLTQTLSPENSGQTSSWLEDLNGDGSHDWKDLTVDGEEIYRISDRSGDGIADYSQLYLRDFRNRESDVAGAVLSHDEDVFVGIAPDMWRTRDTNDDGMADSKTSISYGYGVHLGFRGHGMSGLTTGPDGRIYWSVGDVGLNVEGPDGKRWFYPNQGAILRSEPDGSNFEVFAAGLRNPHEFSFDQYGNMISVDHDGDHAGEQERVVYIVNGSDSGWRINWQFGKYTDPKNNDYKVWMDENYFKPRFEDQAAHILPPVANYINGAAGMAYNPGTALSDKWKDHFFVSYFVGGASGSAINAFTLEPKGASFELDTDQPFMRGILPTGLDFGPDGALYFADWIESWNTNDMGRIWRIDYPDETGSAIRKETKQLLGDDFAAYEEERLFSLLRHEDMRVRKKAQFEFVDRSSKQHLLEAVEQQDHQLARLHGIWGVGQLAREEIEEAESLVPYLKDGDPEIRAQVAKTLGDVRYSGDADALLPLLKDESLRVQFFAAQALGRIRHRPAVQPIVDMLEANNDRDIYLRHGGAIALARIGDVQAVAQLSDHPSEAVRIAAVVALKRMEAPEVARFLSDESAFVVTNAARAINDDALIKEALPELARMLDQRTFTNTPLLRRAINACLYHGTGTDARRLASFATREGVSDSLRTEAIATLSVWPDPSPLDRVTGRYRGKIQNPKADAVQALSTIIDPILSGGNDDVKIALIKAVSTLKLNEASSDLFALMQDRSSPEVTIAALNTLRDLDYEKMDKAVEMALSSESQRLRMTALRLTPSLDVPGSQKVTLLASVLNEGSIVEQQSAIKALGTIDSEEATELLIGQFEKLTDGSLPEEVHLDVISAADSSNSEKLNTMLKQYEEAKPEDDKATQYRESLYGGDARQGEQIFYNDNTAQCIRCHAVGGDGGNVGPDLSAIGDVLTREQLLESMVAPNKRIAPGFGSVTITTEAGQQIQGVLEEETDSYVTVEVTEGETRKIQREEIAEQINSPSGMYSMEGILSKHELRDLVEFLSRRTNGTADYNRQ
ncbi:putative heme-binding domain-containing protein [Fodinibius roseus]|uniref:Putative heme-binding domain-containing protein n=1 Tax=Fodinibius roseus TaxID=1194090 RepID=A0A1M5F0A3_9BACT|nr:HEAT repeat domain-containing protein [Fodinibius roseus]SHF84848.1 putative heme-binding domain-containing protein [Fodinibius roseus]